MKKKINFTTPPQYDGFRFQRYLMDEIAFDPEVKKKIKTFSYDRWDGIFWFRIFGYGLVIKNTKRHSLLFSERMGITKVLRIGKYAIKILKPNKF